MNTLGGQDAGAGPQAPAQGDRGGAPGQREQAYAGGQHAPGLDDAALGALRAEAAAHASPFIDPVLFRKAQTVLAGVDQAWLTRVAGRPVTRWGMLKNHELYLAIRAAEIDADHLRAIASEKQDAQQQASRQAAAEAAEAARARRKAWERLRGRLPVPVEVWHNWTARHLDGYEQGADHIVVRAGLRADRIRREEGQPLCWTPSRARELRHVAPNVDAFDQKRIPDCKACLRHAANLATAPSAARARPRRQPNQTRYPLTG